MVLTYTIQAKLEARKRAVMDAHKKMESTALRLRMCIVTVVREQHAHSLTEADRKRSRLAATAASQAAMIQRADTPGH